MENIIKEFENLGYKFKESKYFIEFVCNDAKYFWFNKESKTITVGYYHISLEELNLINKVCEELNWN